MFIKLSENNLYTHLGVIWSGILEEKKDYEIFKKKKMKLEIKRHFGQQKSTCTCTVLFFCLFIFWGEDPVLGSKLAPSAIRGIQDQGVIANAKHYINNNEETDRMTVNEILDVRTHMELYAPVFEASIKEGSIQLILIIFLWQ